MERQTSQEEAREGLVGGRGGISQLLSSLTMVSQSFLGLSLYS